jgi:protease IV
MSPPPAECGGAEAPMRRNTKIALVVLGLLTLMAMAGAVTIYFLVFDSTPRIPEDSTLVIHIGGVLSEQPAIPDPLAEVLGATGGTSVIEIDSALRKAAVDDRIKAVVLRIEPLACGMGKVQELRTAIARYRDETSKPIIAWMDYAGNKEYYLAAACTEVYMPAEGMLLFTGLRFSVTFFKGTLDKLGIQAEFTRVGEYKSAVEPYTREEMSDEFRGVLESLADDLYDRMIADIAADRGMEPAVLQGIVDDPPMTAAGAVEAGLVDELLYRDEIEQRLKPADAEEWPLVDLYTYADVSPGSLGLGKGPSVAVIYCEGIITSGESSPPVWGGDASMGSATITRALRDAREDENIEAVVLRIDSPGGSGLASDLIWREVQLTREVKPVIASMSDYAASGGYYIAMGADAIVAEPSTLTGSIGVYNGKMSFSDLYDKVGLSVETVERGQYADLLTVSRAYTPEERDKIAEMVEDFYSSFISKAAQGRGVEPEEIDRVARGRVWTGAQALEVGLVDEVGGFRAALEVAKLKAGIEPDQEVSLVILPEQYTLLDELLGSRGLSSNAADRTGWDTAAAASWNRYPQVDGGLGALATALPELGQPLGQFLAAVPLLTSGVPLALMPYSLTLH